MAGADDGGAERTVPLRTVADRRDLALRRLVVPPGPEPRVRWAVVSELADPGPYLSGGELLLTAGVGMRTSDADAARYVAGLVGAGVSALGFGVTPVHDTVPPALVEQCRRQGLPLLEVPHPTPFAAITQAVGRALEERHVEDLRRLGEAHRALARAVTAAHPADRVVRVLADALGCWVLLAPPPGRTPGAPGPDAAAPGTAVPGAAEPATGGGAPRGGRRGTRADGRDGVPRHDPRPGPPATSGPVTDADATRGPDAADSPSTPAHPAPDGTGGAAEAAATTGRDHGGAPERPETGEPSPDNTASRRKRDGPGRSRADRPTAGGRSAQRPGGPGRTATGAGGPERPAADAAVLYAPAPAGTVPPALSAEVAGLTGRLTASRGPRSAKARMGADEVFLHTVGDPPEAAGVLVIGRPRPFGITDRAVLGTAVALLGLLLRGAAAAVPAPGRLLTRLLLSPDDPGDLASLLPPLTGPSRSSGAAAEPSAPALFRVLRAHWPGRGAPPTAALAALVRSVLVDDPDPPGAASAARGGGDAAVRAVVADRADTTAHLDLLGGLHRQGWVAALSDAVPPEELPAADRRAASLLRRARAAGRPLLWSEAVDPLEAAMGRDAAEAAARAVLGPLAGDDDAARGLRTTLRAWLARHGNWDRAAADLGAHRNSVRYRVGRAERALGVDLADPEHRMRLWFALTRLPDD